MRRCCPLCLAAWDAIRARFLCGRDENGVGCVSSIDAAVKWCRAHGIEPAIGDRRSLHPERHQVPGPPAAGIAANHQTDARGAGG